MYRAQCRDSQRQWRQEGAHVLGVWGIRIWQEPQQEWSLGRTLFES